MNISEAEIRAEVERILASKGFATAGRLSRLLRYVVDKTLAGQADQLKEYSVGVEVFDRDGSYDPRLDSIVRVEAGRLRSRLEEYYAGNGASPVRISLPRGGYVAHFEPRQEAVPPAPVEAQSAEEPRRTWVAWPLTAGLICAVAAMMLWLGGWNRAPQKPAPAIAVLTFGQHSSAAEDVALAARLTEGVTTELARLGTVGVASHISAMQAARDNRSVREIAATLGVNYVLEAEVERDSGGVLLVLRLVNAETDRKVWVSDYRGAADDLRGISQRAAFDVSTELTRRHPR